MTEQELLEEIDNLVEGWHKLDGNGMSLQQYLAMDDNQFDYWAMTANIPPGYLEDFQIHKMWTTPLGKKKK